MIPPLSPLSHQPAPRGARRLPAQERPEQLKVQTPPALHIVPQHLLPKGALEAAAASTPAARRQGEHSETARSRQAPQGLRLSVQLCPRSELRRLLGRELHQQHRQNPLHGPGTAGGGSTSGPRFSGHPGPGASSVRDARPRACVTGMRGVLCLMTVT